MADLVHGEITERIIDSALCVYRTLGPGLLESAYESCLFYELQTRRVNVKRQVDLPLQYNGMSLSSGYRLDLVVNDSVIVEVKSVEKLAPIHEAQLLTYLKLAHKRVGLLIDFNVLRLKDGICRRVL